MVTENSRLDYFGQTVNIAARVQGSSGGDELLLTAETFTSDGVSTLLEESGYRVEPLRIPLRGIDDPLMIYRVPGLVH